MEGLTNKEAAQKIGISEASVQERIASAVKKTGARNATHCVALLASGNILNPEPSEELAELTTRHAKLYPLWEKAYELDIEAHNAIIEWRVHNPKFGMVQVDTNKSISGVCGMDKGIDIICKHYEDCSTYGDSRSEHQLDEALETAIDRLREAVTALEQVPEYLAYRKASDRVAALYWELMDI